MNKNNIKNLLFFLNSCKKSCAEYEKLSPKYYLDDDTYCYYNQSADIQLALDYKKLSKEDQQRIIPLMC